AAALLATALLAATLLAAGLPLGLTCCHLSLPPFCGWTRRVTSFRASNPAAHFAVRSTALRASLTISVNGLCGTERRTNSNDASSRRRRMEHLQKGVNKKFVEWHEFSFRTRAGSAARVFPAAILLHHALPCACSKHTIDVKYQEACHGAWMCAFHRRDFVAARVHRASQPCRDGRQLSFYLLQISSVCRDRLRS